MNSLHLNKKDKINRFIAILLIGFISLITASTLQFANLGFIVKILAFLATYICFFLFNKINLVVLATPMTLSYLLPANYLFYFFILLFLILFLGEIASGRKKKLYLPFSISFLILLVFSIIATVKAYNIWEGIENLLIVFVIPILFIIGVYNSEYNFNDFKKFLKYLVIIAAVVGLTGIFIALSNPTERIGSTWRTAMTINAFYIFSFFISLGFLVSEKENSSKLIFTITTIFILFGMLFTYTRIALLGVIFGVFILVLKFERLRKIGISLLLLLVLFIPSSMLQRAGKNIFLDPSVIIRLFAWLHSIDLVKAHPFLGIGFDTWKNTYSHYIPFKWLYAEHPHNLFIKLTLELGIIGMLAYFSIITRIMVRYFNKIKLFGNDEFLFAIFVAALAVLFSCLTDVFAVKLPIAIFFWFTLAFMLKFSDTKIYELDAGYSTYAD